MRFLIIGIVLLLMISCGNKGPLYLPEDPQPSQEQTQEPK